MAKIEIFSGKNANINLSASVGKNGVNLRDDVMVVQAMLKYALEKRPFFRGLKFSRPNGTMDENTKKIIKEYQRYLKRKKKLDVSVDGLINRAIGENIFGKGVPWTILCLNDHVMETRLIEGGVGSHFNDLCRKYPELETILVDLPIGTLDLPLESAAPRFGSLGLALE